MDSTKQLTDYDYWQQLRRGSASALEALYDQFFPQLFRYGVQLIPDRALVQDTLQDLFVELYTDHATLSDVQQVRPYLYVCFRRKLLARSKTKSIFKENYSSLFTPSHEHQLILQQLSQEQIQWLNMALKKLSTRQKEAVFLRFYEEMSYEEIASVLHLKKVKYARTLVYRAIEHLRQHLKQEESTLTLYSSFPWYIFIKV